jgi:putative FmdB family regulatory protein
METSSAQNIGIMPLFEYECRACGRQFEYLSRSSEKARCPSCDSLDLQKLLSVFAVGSNDGVTNAGPKTFGACGSCGDPRGPGACNMN